MLKKPYIFVLLIVVKIAAVFGASRNPMSLSWDTDPGWSSEESEHTESSEGDGKDQIYINPLFSQQVPSPIQSTPQASTSTQFQPSLETGFLYELYESNLLHHYDSLQLLNCLKRTWIAQQAYHETKGDMHQAMDGSFKNHIKPQFHVRDRLTQQIKSYWYETDIGKNNILSEQAAAFIEYIIKAFEAFVESELVMRALAKHTYVKALRCATTEFHFKQIFRRAISNGYLEIAICMYRNLQRESIATVCLVQDPKEAHDVLMAAWESWKERCPTQSEERTHRFWRLMSKLLHLFDPEYYTLLTKSHSIDEQHWLFLITRMIDGTFNCSDLLL